MEVWAAQTDRTLLFATTPGVLRTGGALAIEAQHAPRDGQVVIKLHPHSMGARNEIAEFVRSTTKSIDEELQKDLPGEKSKRINAGTRRLVVAALTALTQPIADARSVQIAARLDRKSGFLFQIDIEHPAPRAAAQPFATDPALPIADDRTTVFAMGHNPAVMDVLTSAMSGTGRFGKSLAKGLDTFLTTLVAGASCTVSFAPPPMTVICAFPLRPGVTPKRALDGYAAMLNHVQGWNDEVVGRGIVKTKVKRSKDVIEIETTKFESDPTERAVRVALYGGDTIRSAVAVRDGRLFQVQGANPRELLRQIGAQKSDMAKAPILTATLARHRGAEGLAYFDFLSLFTATTRGVRYPAAKQVIAMMGAVPGLTELRAPLVLTLRGGATTGIDVQIPFQAFVNVAQVVRPFMGLMGAQP